MNNFAIKTENLGKRYKLGATVDLSRTFREVMLELPRSFVNLTKNKAIKLLKAKQNKIDNDPETPKDTFWALRDINIEIGHGEVVGIIGRNGAGKSTLLRILSQITSPTKGVAKINGRVGSLLEVGTGFHPELTGRENIYLNGSILGMTKTEINSKFDEIVAFAEVKKFLDTPIKRYSSGMKVRLAFAVAAHLEPEILVVDEVLAVGDAAFQKKCLGKMSDVSREGRTVLFVSHNIGAIELLCQRAIVLESGKMALDTKDVRDGIKEYLHSSGNEDLRSEWINPDGKFDNPHFKPLRFAITDRKGNTLKMPVMRSDEEMYVWIDGEITKKNKNLMIGFTLYNEKNYRILTSYNTDTSVEKWLEFEEGKATVIGMLPKKILNNGLYRLEMSIRIKGTSSWIVRHARNSPLIFFDIEGKISDSPYYLQSRNDILSPIIEWEKIQGNKHEKNL